MSNEFSDLLLELFIVGDTELNRKHVQTISKILSAHNVPSSALQIIDLAEQPEQATERDILAIPTLIKSQPIPPVRVIGDMSNEERIWSIIGS